MHSEWSAEHDTPPTAPTPPVGVSPSGGADQGGRVDVAVVDVDRSPPVDGNPSEAEEELHRSAVDAVDGLLDEVELALARLDDGTYGRCEGCGAPIDDERLAELPIVRTCGRCDGVDGDSQVTGHGASATA